MYVPKANEETRVEVMHALVRAHPLGTWTLLHAHVSRLSDVHEAAERAPWAVADAPEDYVGACSARWSVSRSRSSGW